MASITPIPHPLEEVSDFLNSRLRDVKDLNYIRQDNSVLSSFLTSDAKAGLDLANNIYQDVLEYVNYLLIKEMENKADCNIDKVNE